GEAIGHGLYDWILQRTETAQTQRWIAAECGREGLLENSKDGGLKHLTTTVTTMRAWNVRRLSRLSIVTLSKRLNPQIRGWFTYYGAFYPSALQGIREAIECRLTKWVKGKYPRKRSRRLKAYSWLTQIKQWRPTLFAHW